MISRFIIVYAVSVPWWTSCRVRFSGLCFLGFFFLYAQRVNLSIAIVCMVRTELAPPLITNFNSNTTNLPLVTSIPENVTSAYPQGIPNQTVVEGNPRSLAGKCPIPPNLQAIVSASNIISTCTRPFIVTFLITGRHLFLFVLSSILER